MKSSKFSSRNFDEKNHQEGKKMKQYEFFEKQQCLFSLKDYFEKFEPLKNILFVNELISCNFLNSFYKLLILHT